MRDGIFYAMPSYQFYCGMCCILWMLFNVKGDDTMITVILAVASIVAALYLLAKLVKEDPHFGSEADTTVPADIEEQCSGCCGGCKNPKT